MIAVAFGFSNFPYGEGRVCGVSPKGGGSAYLGPLKGPGQSSGAQFSAVPVPPVLDSWVIDFNSSKISRGFAVCVVLSLLIVLDCVIVVRRLARGCCFILYSRPSPSLTPPYSHPVPSTPVPLFQIYGCSRGSLGFMVILV